MTVRVYYFVYFSDRVIDRCAVVADTADSATGACCIIERARIIMTELHDNKIAGFKMLQDPFPSCFPHEGATASAADRIVFDTDLYSIEITGDKTSPAPEILLTCARAIFHCGITDDIDHRFLF